MRVLACLVALCQLTVVFALQAELVKDGVGNVTQATVETAHYRLLVDVGKGGRVMSLVDKAAQTELIRKDDSGLGGLFEDRPIFSVSEYQCRATKNTPEELVLKCTVTRDSVGLTKTYTFTEGKPYFGIHYEIQNGTQLPFKLWIRNFANPGDGPVTEADRAYLRNEGKLVDVAFPGTYFKSLDAPWAAYLDTEKKCGYFVRCDFDLLDSFYFWNGSRIIPTFEWIYKPVPPGQKVATNLTFGLLTAAAPADMPAELPRLDAAGQLVAPQAEERSEPKFAAIPDWKPLEELYRPVQQEQQRGFIAVVSGQPAPAPRLTSIQVDVGLQEAEAVPVELFALGDKVDVKATVTGAPFTVQVEDGGWLKEGDTLTLERGRSGRLWLKLDTASRKPGVINGTLALSSGQWQPLAIPLQLTTWNVKLPEKPVIGTQFYASVPTLSSYDLTDDAKRKFVVMMDNMQLLHCDNLDWGVGPHRPAVTLKVAGTGELLSEWGKKHPDTPVADLPDLDFSYFDIWFEEPVKRNMTRFVAHVPTRLGWREAALMGSALGHKVENPDTELGWEVMGWYYRQLRKYAEAKGFTSFWAKISDEIPQEEIPEWLEAAAKYRAAGYQPFTTNTGNIARSAALLQEMNKNSDAWQVAFCLSREFMELTRKGAAFETKREPITGKWLGYGNGGAVDTWATKVFGGDRPAERIDQVQIFAGGQPLTMRGGSGWGNKDHGVAMQHGDYIYLSMPDGSNPNGAQIEISYRLRTTQEGGEPVVKLEPTDELWYYGGGSYKKDYEGARAYPWRVCAFNMRGYGWWTYYWHNNEDILVRYRPETNDLLISGAWEGVRDGNEDAAYFRLAERKLARDKAALARLRQVFGTGPDAILRMGEVKREIYTWDDFINPSQAAYNAAKREALRVLAE